MCNLVKRAVAFVPNKKEERWGQDRGGGGGSLTNRNPEGTRNQEPTTIMSLQHYAFQATSRKTEILVWPAGNNQ